MTANNVRPEMYLLPELLVTNLTLELRVKSALVSQMSVQRLLFLVDFLTFGTGEESTDNFLMRRMNV